MTDKSIVIGNLRNENTFQTIAVECKRSGSSSKETEFDESSTGIDGSASDYTNDDSENTENEGNVDQGNHRNNVHRHQGPNQDHCDSDNHGVMNYASDTLGLSTGLDQFTRFNYR
jgi:hypothetical protein